MFSEVAPPPSRGPLLVSQFEICAAVGGEAKAAVRRAGESPAKIVSDRISNQDTTGAAIISPPPIGGLATGRMRGAEISNWDSTDPFTPIKEGAS